MSKYKMIFFCLVIESKLVLFLDMQWRLQLSIKESGIVVYILRSFTKQQLLVSSVFRGMVTNLMCQYFSNINMSLQHAPTVKVS